MGVAAMEGADVSLNADCGRQIAEGLAAASARKPGGGPRRPRRGWATVTARRQRSYSRGAGLAFALGFFLSVASLLQAGRDLVLVRGVAGDPEFETEFAETEAAWSAAAERAGDIRVQRVAAKPELRKALETARPEAAGELWIVLIGHGTDDGRTAKFNLAGDDVSAAELAAWLKPWTKSLIVINGSSSSAAFIPALSGRDRVIITATQSGAEVFAPRFGLQLARVLAAPETDLDRDGAVSLLEASVVAANRVAAGYQAGNQLAAEHALLDDNGDGKGTRLDWFEGLRLAKQPQEGASGDGWRARHIALVPAPADRGLAEEQRRRRDELERALEELKRKRATMAEPGFFREAEGILLELGRLKGVGAGERGAGN